MKGERYQVNIEHNGCHALYGVRGKDVALLRVFN